MERVGTRKLQKQSGSLYLSLPRFWTHDQHLDRGSPIDVFVEGERLILVGVKHEG